MFKLSCLFVLMVVAGQYAACSPVTEYEYIQEADAWLRLHMVPAIWQDAGLRCYLEGGILASPSNDAMATAMVTMMKSHKMFSRSVFTGIHDHSSKGEFVSVDGVPLDDMSLEWAEGQPDNMDNAEDCLALTGAGALHDVSCAAVLPYFCRKMAPASAAQTPQSASLIFDFDRCGKDGYDWEPRTGSCYKFHPTGKSWHRALKTCHTEGGHLAIINSDAESQVLTEIFEIHRDDVTEAYNDAYAHIGFLQMIDTGSMWLTINGETLEEAGFDKWTVGEPNNNNEEHCGSIYKDGLLNDISCGIDDDSQRFAFICEFTP